MKTKILLVVSATAFAGAVTMSAQRQTVRDVMERVVIPESTAIFDINDSPTNDAAWREVRRRGDRLADAGEQLLRATPGTNRDEWTMQVRAYLRASGNVQAAADRKNFDALLEASDQLAATCVNCHRHFLPEKAK